MIGFYNYTVILTYMGTMFGLLGILSAFSGNLIFAIAFLMLTGVCDMFDGKIARTMKRNKDEKRFGIQIDSLSDFLCFGILPAIIGYSIGMNTWYLIIILLYYMLAALIRLAYFNVMEEKRQETTEEDIKMCTGLPVPPSAIIFPILFLLSKVFHFELTYLYAVVMALVGTLFITKFKIKKLQIKGLLVMIGIGLVVLSLLIFLNN